MMNGKFSIGVQQQGELKKTASGDRWFLNGLPHRIGGPAIEFGDFRVWYRHGLLHREDGPAIIYPNGDREFWIDGMRLG